MNKNDKKMMHLCIPAADRMMDSKSRMYQPHLHMIAINSGDFDLVESIKKDAKIFLMYNCKPDLLSRYVVKWSRTKESRGDGEKKTYIEGAVEILNKKLHDFLVSKYNNGTNKFIGDYKPCYVTYGTLNPKKVQLYPEFDLQMISSQCT
jgi:hypothetical protein